MVHPIQTFKIIRIGNSKGIRLPKQLLARYHIGDSIQVETTDKGILLSPINDEKKSWEDTYQAMAAANDQDFQDMDLTISDGLDEQ